MQKITLSLRALLTAALVPGCSTPAVNHELGEPVSLDAGTTEIFAGGFSVSSHQRRKLMSVGPRQKYRVTMRATAR